MLASYLLTSLLVVLALQLVVSVACHRWLSRSLLRDHESLLKDYSDLADRYYESVKSQVESSEAIRRIEDDAELAKDLLQKRIDELTRDIERYETLRDTLVGNIDSLANELHRANKQVITLERSLRVARHKEWKRWKKSEKRRYLESVPQMRPTCILSREFNHFRWVMRDGIHPITAHRDTDYASWEISYAKSQLRKCIARIRTMDPYPLP